MYARNFQPPPRFADRRGVSSRYKARYDDDDDDDDDEVWPTADASQDSVVMFVGGFPWAFVVEGTLRASRSGSDCIRSPAAPGGAGWMAQGPMRAVGQASCTHPQNCTPCPAPGIAAHHRWVLLWSSGRPFVALGAGAQYLKGQWDYPSHIYSHLVTLDPVLYSALGLLPPEWPLAPCLPHRGCGLGEGMAARGHLFCRPMRQ